jgi:UDP-glucose 4-epimerase
MKAGHHVVVYDNLTKGNRQAIPKGATLIVGDVDDRPHLRAVFERYSFHSVLHFAAFIEAGESMEAPARYFRNNTCHTLTLLEVMVEQGVRRLVFSSTAALYGEPKRIPIGEDEPLCPTNAYGESKLLVERMLAWFHRIHGLGYASLRYFNAAGACNGLGEDHEPESHLIPIVLQVALGQRENIAIYGTDYATEDGTCVRDYIHVGDLASAHLLALDELCRSGQPAQLIYNLGNGRGFSVRQVIEAARRVTGRAIPAVERPRRPGDPAVLVASSEKIRRTLGWHPEHSDIDAIIRSAWEWRKLHPHGYRGEPVHAPREDWSEAVRVR